MDKANAEIEKDGQEGHDDGQQQGQDTDDKVPGLVQPEDHEHETKYTDAEWLAHMEQQKRWNEVDAEEAAMTTQQKAGMEKGWALFPAQLA